MEEEEKREEEGRGICGRGRRGDSDEEARCLRAVAGKGGRCCQQRERNALCAEGSILARRAVKRRAALVRSLTLLRLPRSRPLRRWRGYW